MEGMAAYLSCLTSKIFIGSMIERRRDYEKKEPCRDAHKIYVICEGSSTEPDYFKFFQGLSSNLEIITIPSVDGKTDPVKLKEQAEVKFLNEKCEYELDYRQGDVVWFVIDTDRWEEKDKIKILRSFCEEQNDNISWTDLKTAKYSAWKVAQSNPSFEIWLYYHAFKNKPTDEAVSKYASFKEFVGQAFAGGFDFESDPVRISEAIRNSEHNFAKYADSITKYSSEMHFLGCEIYNFVKGDIRRLRNKLKNG